MCRQFARAIWTRLVLPDTPLDILAQQIVAMCAAEDWSEDDLFRVVRRAFPYRNLARAEFDEIVEMLSEGIASRRDGDIAPIFIAIA